MMNVQQYFRVKRVSVDPTWVWDNIQAYRALHPNQSNYFNTTTDGANLLKSLEDRLFGIGENQPFLWNNFNNRRDGLWFLIFSRNSIAHNQSTITYTNTGVPVYVNIGNTGWITGGPTLVNFSQSLPLEGFTMFVNGLNFSTVTSWVMSSRSYRGQMPVLNLPLATNIVFGINQFTGILPTLNLPNVQTFDFEQNSFGRFMNQNFPECTFFSIRGSSHIGFAPPSLTLPKVVTFRAFNTFRNISGSGTFDCPTYNFPECTEFQMQENNMFTGRSLPNHILPKVLTFTAFNCGHTGNLPQFNYPLLRNFDVNRNNFADSLSLSHWNETNFPQMQTFNVRTININFNIPALFFPNCNTYLLFQNRTIQSQQDAFYQSLYTRRFDITVTSLVNIEIWGGGTVASPSGVYQNSSTPTTGYEYIFKLINNPDNESIPRFRIRTNDGIFESP